ncbi:MAG: Uma2 family endonuclease [Armatimonadetes bacterium]|nr:Uma2 family endonuclease [Armatimonadota bacterium]
MSAPARQRLTEQEYLAIERAAEWKSEFYDGEMFAMAGATREHNLITLNVAADLLRQLKGRPCEAYASDMRVKVEATGLYTYPDVVAVCGERRFADERQDTLLNPTLIIEVLFPSTEAYDRGEKFAHYRRLASLREYVLIAQDRPRVERFVRQEGGQEWVFTEASGLQETVPLSSIGCQLTLAEIYDRVEFPPDAGVRLHTA